MAKKKGQNTSPSGWFKKGKDGFEEKKKLDAVAEKRKEKYAPRFWLKPDEEAKIVFLDSEGFYIKEHNLKIGGKWGNFVTCTDDFAPCAVCKEGYRPTYTAYYTVIDGRKYTTTDGKVVKNRKVLIPLKGSAINFIEDLKKKHKNLRGIAMKVKRYTSNDPNCGNYFEVLGKVNLSKFEDNKPYDYEVILAPPTDEELEALGMDTTVVGSEEDVGAEIDDIFNEVEDSDEKEEATDDSTEENLHELFS